MVECLVIVVENATFVFFGMQGGELDWEDF